MDRNNTGFCEMCEKCYPLPEGYVNAPMEYVVCPIDGTVLQIDSLEGVDKPVGTEVGIWKRR